ncbi:tRNA (N6-threonylcarbamoyladenosine(37)-N6)-methyltransferase TrmO [Neochlamydia sp. AcF95]|uniref:tRNA (N6-threonylcarbamoyladenosine(37)-N6)-methyltransferase TrmO n=1 Tax=Neochlamydia sp. AcF95 TaxID=2795734 RepID=UPI001BC91709|nr:tRNA (N6-threonylcarbamoyladenosine(37)-N6)-methyltransferase TrmO [Neochlamydia sp. AcF95]
MQSTSLSCSPIGYFYTSEKERYSLPKQAGLFKNNKGKILLNRHQNFEQALHDLAGFNKIWVIFWFHRNHHWKPKVLTPHGPPKRGLFATRSPHRPNPLGLSCLEITGVSQLEIDVVNHDLLDGTPILDIKPYIEYVDAWTDTQQGWLESCKKKSPYPIIWEEEALAQVSYLNNRCSFNFQEEINFRLATHPYPSSNNRILHCKDNDYLLAYKTWRFFFRITLPYIHVIKIGTGYDRETIKGEKKSAWNDVDLHREFLKKFTLSEL